MSRNTQIPEEAIEEEVKENELNLEICSCIIKAQCERTVQIPKKENTETKTEVPNRKEIYSTDLDIGMEIPAITEEIKTKTNTKEQEEGPELD